MTKSTFAIRLAATLAIVTAATAASAAPWTTIGSAGVVDEADTGLIDFASGEARLRADAATGSVLNLRYNIVALEGFTGLNQVAWLARFRDNGAGSRMRLFLRQYHPNGTTSTIDTFDSNSYASAVGYQTRTRCTAVDWDFADGPYYIEAELTRSADGGMPALGLMSLTNANCTP
ncbi:hypothetical protein [Ideonella sp. YS5]|uniref:hypothetical protein n=1 Tax=Ideonella sp. YS5 TaxID=3453714 RepID=UPI003EEE6131